MRQICRKSHIALATVCLVFGSPIADGAAEVHSPDPRPSAAEVLTWRSPDGRPESEPGFQPYQDSAGTVARLSREAMIPFMQFGKPLSPSTLYYEYYKSGIRRFPDVQSCLIDSEGARAQPDLTNFDWAKFRNSRFAEVCLFRIATSYRSAKDFADWLERQGFKTSSGYILKYRPDRNYPNTLDFQVHGKWSVQNQGALVYKNQDVKNDIEEYINSYSVTLGLRVDVGILQISAGYDHP